MLALSAAYNMWPSRPPSGFCPVRPFRDLFIDRRNLHAVPVQMKALWLQQVLRWRMGERRHRHGSEAGTSRAVRSSGVVLCLLLVGAVVIAYDSFASASRARAYGFSQSAASLFSRRAVSFLAGLRFHNAIWHGFVLIAAICHYRRSSLACHGHNRPWHVDRWVPQKKKRGAPGKGTLIALRLAPGLLARVDRWAASQKDAPSRPRKPSAGLSSWAPRRRSALLRKAAKAAEMAGHENRPLG